MTTRIALTHCFESRYPRRVTLPTHWLRLRPAPHTKAEISAYSLKIDTEAHFLNWLRDPFENHLARLDLPEPVSALKLTVDLVADLSPVNPFEFLTEVYAANYPFEYPEQLRKELKPYLHLPEPGPRLADFFGGLGREPAYIVESLGQITGYVHRGLAISGQARPGAVNADAVLARGSGSPWEAAWLLVLCLRHLGLAARFTSGYRVFLAPASSPIHAWSENSPAGSDPGFADSASLHAWAEVFLPGGGWIGLDPSAGIFTHEGYLPLAATPDPLRARPWVAETFDDQEPLAVVTPLQVHESLRIRRLLPAPAPAPYTEAQWRDIQALGKLVDEQLRVEKLELAMAPSACFTAWNSGAPEWSTVVGPAQRNAAEDLIARLRLGLAPGGVLHEGQGEWFSGEPLPRWRLNCYFRADGQAIWRHSKLLGAVQLDGDPKGTSPSATLPQGFGARLRWPADNAGRELADAADAERFARALARALGVSADSLMPAHEDPLYDLWLNRRHIQFEPPAEVLRNPIQRRALAAKLSKTSQAPVGFALPLRWDHLAGRWSTGTWNLRRSGLYLMPGASAMGYRLPLDGLPAGDDAPHAIDPERCPFEERPLLPEIYGELSARLTRFIPHPAPPDAADPDLPPAKPPRTALCVEVREGRLAVFLPPLTHLEHWLDLVATVEAAAEAAGLPVLLEGYEPPEDCRLRRLTIEPDAGILRIVLPASDSSEELSVRLATIYREAEASGLRAERVAGDGRRLPPGGNAEIVLGGTSPTASPFLVRPQLLHSLIAYWQQHPSLSYFFAGQRIGPSGIAPRPDEGRDDALYELDIALARMPLDEVPGPWVPDRALRHLLADPAGDIRKAEIRIDQLYSPDRSSARQGLVGIRSFETAPDARLATVQALLLRALVAYLGRRPADPRLADFGPDLHDRYLLPGPLWEDLREVVRDLGRAGLPVQAEWFEPFRAQRFPVLGRLRIGDAGLELRSAHEPWPVLSEEVTAGGVTRFIDSANQRVQVEIAGFLPHRHVLACNGHRVPMQPTRARGRFFAGVRYKAWTPISTQHPRVPPVHSLVFDLLDARSGEVLGGCTWFPARPDLYGTVAAPPPEPDSDDSPSSRKPRWRPQPAALPPWSPGGRFLEFGSGARHLPIPEEGPRTRFPCLLDLTRFE